MTGEHEFLPRIGGVTMIAALAAAILHEFTGGPALALVAGAFAALGTAAFWTGIPWSRRAFVLIGLGLLALSALTQQDWLPTAVSAVQKAGFIAAFFTAMTGMRAAAMGSEEIVACGRFLSGQPPGRRYLALTLGGHLFGLVLSYGAIALLGALAAESADREPNAEIRHHRTRRMLVAIQRGFVSTLPWSPLAFASAITITLVPDADWARALPYCAVSALLLAAIGWALDTIFKPRLSGPPPPVVAPEGDWLLRLRPLLLLLAVLVVTVAILHALTGVRVVGAVMAIVPVIALAWTVVQAGSGTGATDYAARRATDFVLRDLPGLRSEIVLLVMAAFIGTLGGHLAAPAVAASGLDLAQVPAPLLLLALFWTIPITGQLGMNPILAVSLIAPLLPAPAELGVSPEVVVVTITSGWALSGATSPFTASTLLIGVYGKVAVRLVGQVWNGPYALISGAVLSLWIVLLATFAR
jgi:hypothetical protein